MKVAAADEQFRESVSYCLPCVGLPNIAVRGNCWVSFVFSMIGVPFLWQEVCKV